ncbi:MAG: hypothetical protein DRN24_02410 [Thermoplasmata archaeon]|nr:MAG: hypothetical protein DRN24_02410 [Thermoplasmata archaeon]
MPVKDRVVTWYIRNVILPRREIIDKPGFVITSLSGEYHTILLRDLFLPELLFELIENNIVQQYDMKGRQALYSAGKKFGYIYSSMSSFPTIQNSSKKEFSDFAYFLVRFVEGTYAQQAKHKLELDKKIFTISFDDYIICRHNGIGHIMTEGGITGIWSYAMQDKSIEGVQLECQGRGNERCIVLCAPEKIIKERSNKFFREQDLSDQKFDNIYKTMNAIRPTKYSSNSLKKLLNAGFFKFKRGVLSYKGHRFFACDSYILYFLEEELIKLENGEQILFDTCFEYGKYLRELYAGVDYQKFIPDFFSALGFGDIFVIPSDEIKIASIYYPWTHLSEKSKYVILRGLMSGIVSSSLGKKIEFTKYNISVKNYLTLTIIA